LLAPIAPVEYLQAALLFANDHGVSIAIVELDLTDRPACCVKHPENYRPFAQRNVARCVHEQARGFLPERNPMIGFPSHSEFTELDEIGRDLPSLLQDPALTRAHCLSRYGPTYRDCVNAFGSLDARILHFPEDAFTECLQNSNCLCHAEDPSNRRSPRSKQSALKCSGFNRRLRLAHGDAPRP